MNAIRLTALPTVISLFALCCSCDDFSFSDEREGELFWSVDPAIRVVSVKADMEQTKAEIPDTNDFILKVTDEDGKTLYEGSYGDSPESLLVKAGSYSLSIRSEEFSKPAFSSPQYGDDQTVTVKVGESVHVKLNCRQVNSGVRLKIGSDFLTNFPDGVLFVKSKEGRLMYSYTEKRIAYFPAGDVSLNLYNGGVDKTILTRTVAPSEILTLKISAPEGQANSVSVAVDTSRIWTVEDYILGSDGSISSGGGNTGSVPADAVSVPDAKNLVGEKDVWLYGYIVGGDLSSSGKTVKTSGITKATHFAMASRSSVTAKESCVAVELPKGDIRDALNLVDHPELIGSRVYIKGNVVESYFGTTGLKGCSEYMLK